MEKQKLKRRYLIQGVKYLAITLPLMFMGPIVIHSSFKNQNHPLYYFILSIGITICLLSMWLFFKGIQSLMKSLFGH